MINTINIISKIVYQLISENGCIMDVEVDISIYSYHYYIIYRFYMVL